MDNTAKIEFYDLIGASFYQDEVSSISPIIENLEEDLRIRCKQYSKNTDVELEAFYYDLSSLYYSSAKDFNNFKLNIKNRELPLAYTKYVLQAKNDELKKRNQKYDHIHQIITTFISNSTILKSVKNTASLSFALTNAIVPELLIQDKSEALLSYYKGCSSLQEIASAVQSGKHITRVKFDVNCIPQDAIVAPDVISNFWNDLVSFSAYRLPMPINLDETIATLESQADEPLKRITLRICMVMVRYGVLSKITQSKKYILINEQGEYVSLQQSIMYEVFLLLCKLCDNFKKKSAIDGLPTDRKQSVIQGETLNTKEPAERIKNHIRSGKKGVTDTFTYSDIDDTELGCFSSPAPSTIGF